MIPFLRPNPPRLSSLQPELRRVEDSGMFSNSGPANTSFEAELARDLFGGTGSCVTVGNATLGLMLAIRAVLKGGLDAPDPWPVDPSPRFALMPAFTFAATAQAAHWNGLVPLFCDSRESDWSADPDAEEALIARYGERIAVIIPYATFGTAIDLERYAALGRRTGIPVVVDAATSLGSMDALGRQFGSGSSLPIVFSMHATKTFATAEGGVVFSADPVLVDRIRSMANFGFEIPRTTSLPGLNAKLSEVHAVLARARLRGFDAVMQRRQRLDERYRERLPDWQFQEETGRRSGCSFLSVLLPRREYRDRAEIVAELHHRGIGTAAYFSPHLGQQPFFAACPRGPLPVADEIAARVLCLPIWDGLEADAVNTVCDTLREVVACSTLFRPYPQFPGVRA